MATHWGFMVHWKLCITHLTVQTSLPQVLQRWRKGERREGQGFQLEVRLASQCPTGLGCLLPSLEVLKLKIKIHVWIFSLHLMVLVFSGITNLDSGPFWTRNNFVKYLKRSRLNWLIFHNPGRPMLFNLNFTKSKCPGFKQL